MPLPLPKPLTASDSLSRWLMQLREAVRRAQVRDSEVIKATETVEGTHLRLTQRGGGSGAALRQLRLRQIQNDYLICRTFQNATLGTEDVYVARDPELRLSRFHGQAVVYSSDGDVFTASFTYQSPTKRIKTIGTVAETQVILPYYLVISGNGDRASIITAMESSDATGIIGPEGPIDLVELTQRAWYKFQ